MLVPQQLTEPFVRTPQVWVLPALSVVKAPDGGVERPLPLWPQQATTPLVLRAQVCAPPALTALKVPPCGVD